MQKKSLPRQPTSVLLPEDLHADAKRAAESLSIPLSTFIRGAIKERTERLLKGDAKTARRANANAA